MLWLPKWLTDQPVSVQNCPWCGEGTWNGTRCLSCGATESDKPSRRTFLFMGAAAGVAALLPPPPVDWCVFDTVVRDKASVDWLTQALDNNRTFIVPVHVGRNFVASADLPGRLGFTNVASTRIASVSCVPPCDTRPNYYNVRVNAAELAAIQRDGWRSPVLAERLQTEYGLVRRPKEYEL